MEEWSPIGSTLWFPVGWGNCVFKMKDLLEHFPFKKVGTYATVIGIFIYNVLSERDVACTCKDQTHECWIYIILPVVVIMFLLLWVEKPFQRVFRYYCTFQFQCMSLTEWWNFCIDKVKKCYNKVKKCYDKVKKCYDKVEKYDCKYLKELVLSLPSVLSGFTKRVWTHVKFCVKQLCSKKPLCIIVHYILKNALLSLLWILVVLIDGDWYVCCMNDGSEKQAQLACKDNKNITAEEEVIIDELKNRSKVSVFILHRNFAYFFHFGPVWAQMNALVMHQSLIVLSGFGLLWSRSFPVHSSVRVIN